MAKKSTPAATPSDTDQKVKICFERIIPDEQLDPNARFDGRCATTWRPAAAKN